MLKFVQRSDPPKPGKFGRQRIVTRSRGLRGGPIDLPLLVRRVVNKKIPAEAQRLIRIQNEWSQLVGARIAQRTAPALVRSSVLFVDVRDVQWRHELEYMRNLILERISATLGPNLVSELRWRVDRSPQFLSHAQAMELYAQKVRALPDVTTLPPRKPALSPDIPSATQAALQRIADPRLRALAQAAREAMSLPNSQNPDAEKPHRSKW